MCRSLCDWPTIPSALLLLLVGCATLDVPSGVTPNLADYVAFTEMASTQEKSAQAPSPTPPPKEPVASARPLPAYAQLETLPIDLPTVLRLVEGNSPVVGFAQARVREAQARVAQAEVLWLPNLSVGVAYNRFDGQTQNQRGDVFGVSRANLFPGGGPTLTLDMAESIYRPLIERRLEAAAVFRQEATVLGVELDAVGTYFDLVQAQALLDINADTLQRAEEMLKAAQNAKEYRLDRTAGDVNRGQTEVFLRRTERLDLEGRRGAASARLVKILQLSPTVQLLPADVAVSPITLVEPETSLDQLLSQALANRPDLAADREVLAAAWTRVRKQEMGPLFPRLLAGNQTGLFGGGRNDDLQDFRARNALSVQLVWELKNLGLGNRAEVEERRALLDQANFHRVEAQAHAIAQIVEAAHLAAARYSALDLAEHAVKEALELYRISKEGTLNVVDAKNLFDALRPLQAIQVLNQARQNYLAAIIDFNRAQYRLFTLTGRRPLATVK